jgi:DNA-binding MarR family transcriptional regulator
MQFDILGLIALHPESQRVIVDQIDSDRSTVSEVVLRVRGAGLVTMTAGEYDERRRVVTITAAGRKALAASLARVAQAERQFLSRLLPDDRTRLRQILEILAQPSIVTDADWHGVTAAPPTVRNRRMEKQKWPNA